MRVFLAILFALLAVLPHPALFVGACGTASVCAPAAQEDMAPGCACCEAGKCGCALQAPERAPVAPSPAPFMNGADFYPVVVMPPLEETNLATLPVEPERGGPAGVVRSTSVAGVEVPLFVWHRAFLI